MVRGNLSSFGISQRPSLDRRPNGYSGCQALLGGPKWRSRFLNGPSISSKRASRFSPSCRRPRARRSSSGLCGARLPLALHGLSSLTRERKSLLSTCVTLTRRAYGERPWAFPCRLPLRRWGADAQGTEDRRGRACPAPCRISRQARRGRPQGVAPTSDNSAFVRCNYTVCTEERSKCIHNLDHPEDFVYLVRVSATAEHRAFRPSHAARSSGSASSTQPSCIIARIPESPTPGLPRRPRAYVASDTTGVNG